MKLTGPRHYGTQNKCKKKQCLPPFFSSVPRSTPVQSAAPVRPRLGLDAVSHLRRSAVALPVRASVQLGQLQPVGGLVQPPEPRG